MSLPFILWGNLHMILSSLVDLEGSAICWAGAGPHISLLPMRLVGANHIQALQVLCSSGIGVGRKRDKYNTLKNYWVYLFIYLFIYLCHLYRVAHSPILGLPWGSDWKHIQTYNNTQYSHVHSWSAVSTEPMKHKILGTHNLICHLQNAPICIKKTEARYSPMMDEKHRFSITSTGHNTLCAIWLA